MSIRTTLLGVFVAASLAACQTPSQRPVNLAKDKIGAQTGRVGVVMSDIKTDLYLPGADCLLCIGVATMANTSLNVYSKTLKSDELQQVKGELVEILRKKGVEATVVDAPVAIRDLPKLSLGANMATRDFASFKDRFDHLIVIEVNKLGFERGYRAYVPTGPARATLQGSAYMVDLKTNAYEWYDVLTLWKGADGQWDEAPAFPGLTSAYYQAIEMGKDRVKQPFN